MNLHISKRLQIEYSLNFISSQLTLIKLVNVVVLTELTHQSLSITHAFALEGSSIGGNDRGQRKTNTQAWITPPRWNNARMQDQWGARATHWDAQVIWSRNLLIVSCYQFILIQKSSVMRILTSTENWISLMKQTSLKRLNATQESEVSHSTLNLGFSPLHKPI